MVGKQALWEGAKALLKTGVLGVAVFAGIQGVIPLLGSSGALPLTALVGIGAGSSRPCCRPRSWRASASPPSTSSS